MGSGSSEPHLSAVSKRLLSARPRFPTSPSHALQIVSLLSPSLSPFFFFFSLLICEQEPGRTFLACASPRTAREAPCRAGEGRGVSRRSPRAAPARRTGSPGTPPPLPLLLFRPPPAPPSPPSHPLPGNFLVPFLTTPGNQWSLEERGLGFHVSNSNVSGDSCAGMRLAAQGDFTFCFVLTFSAVVAFPARSLSVSLSLFPSLSLCCLILPVLSGRGSPASFCLPQINALATHFLMLHDGKCFEYLRHGRSH